MAETSKAKARRDRENWFNQYAPPESVGIDIGCQEDPLYEHYRKWDLILGDGDATFMEGVADNSYQVVYSSHILEHVNDPITAIKNWYRILAPGGNLIILVPHRDLYETSTKLPSKWNFEHRSMWLPTESDLVDTKNFKQTILDAIPNVDIISFRILDEGYDYSIPPNQHPSGEYSIEAIIKKPENFCADDTI
jgi:SAM-dependent methyltransferase